MTNLEKIRQLSADDLAEFISSSAIDVMDKICLASCGPGGECTNGENCKACVVSWLESEVDPCTP